MNVLNATEFYFKMINFMLCEFHINKKSSVRDQACSDWEMTGGFRSVEVFGGLDRSCFGAVEQKPKESKLKGEWTREGCQKATVIPGDFYLSTQSQSKDRMFSFCHFIH